MSLPKRKEVYTYEDYLNWPDEQRIELIDGQVYLHTLPISTHLDSVPLPTERFFSHKGSFYNLKPLPQ